MTRRKRTITATILTLVVAATVPTAPAIAEPIETGQILDCDRPCYRGKGTPGIKAAPAPTGTSVITPQSAANSANATQDSAKPAKSANARSANSIPVNGAGAMFPGTVYQNQHQIPGAEGSIHANMPGGTSTPLMLHMTFRNLLPGKTYKVYLDKDGTTATGNHSFGPWTEVGQFSSNPAGNGQFQYQAAPGSIPSGTHTWAVFVYRADAGATVLISDNITFTLP